MDPRGVLAMSHCLDCGAAVTDGRSVCEGAVDEFSTIVGGAPSMLDELETTRVRLSRMGGGGRRPKSAETPLPFDQRAALAAAVMRDVLSGALIRLIGTIDTTDPTAEGSARALYALADVFRGHPSSGAILSRLRAAQSRALRAIDRPDHYLYAGPCWGCGSPLYAQPGAGVAVCRDCGEAHDVERLGRHLLETAEQWLATVQEIAAVLSAWAGFKVSEDAVQGYVRRGDLRQRGSVMVNGKDAATYRFGEALELARRAARRRPNREKESA
jgi:hypothetical protein